MGPSSTSRGTPLKNHLEERKPLVDLAFGLLWNNRVQIAQNHPVKSALPSLLVKAKCALKIRIPAQRTSLVQICPHVKSDLTFLFDTDYYRATRLIAAGFRIGGPLGLLCASSKSLTLILPFHQMRPGVRAFTNPLWSRFGYRRQSTTYQSIGKHSPRASGNQVCAG